MISPSWRGMFVPLLVLGITCVGCAKRPATTQASAPSPIGSAASTPGGAGRAGAAVAGPGAGQAAGGGAVGTPGAGPGGGQAGAGAGRTSPGGGAAGGGAVSTAPGAGAGAAGGGAVAGGAGAQPGGATAPGAAPRPSIREFTETTALQDIYFDFDQSTIRPDAARTLDANASWMKSNANHLILIEGHCDERGTNEYNLALGERRARSTMNYLVAQGVQASRITIISYGEERPTCSEKTEACWGKNRRAHFLVKAR